MKYLKSLTLIIVVLTVFLGCSDDSADNPTTFDELAISKNDINLQKEEVTTIQIIKGSGAYNVKSSDDNTASASVKKSIITIIGKKTGNVTIVLTDKKTKQTKTIKVSIATSKDVMVTKWKTVQKDGKTYIAINTKGGGKYKCKKVGSYEVVAEGTLVNEEKKEIDLTESGVGEYIIELTPSSKTDSMVLYMGQTLAEESNALLEISQWGNFRTGTNTSMMLRGCKNVKISATDIPDFSEVTDMNNMFYECISISKIPNINKWNVSKVTDMNNMFNGVYKFNSPIGDWKTSNVKNMARMFAQKGEEYVSNPEEAKGKFNQDISKWDVSNVTNMSAMFRNCVEFNQNISEWDVKNVVYMTGIFLNANKFNNNIGSWNLSKVYDMSEMFSGASGFNQDISGWNVSAVSNMEAMFKGATSFNQNIGNWNVGNVSKMSEMFAGAISFNQSLKWNTSKVKHFKNMFKGASSFNQNLASFKIRKSYTSGMIGMLDESGLSCENYDATLKAWAEDKDTKTGRKFSAIGLTYTNKASRDKLISEKGWTILDGDKHDPNCKN